MRALLVPGYTGSGPEHWQTWLQTRYQGIGRVKQEDWDWVDREAWIDALDAHVRSTDEEILLVGHSCGAVTIAQWAASRSLPPHVTGAVLVAPADVDSELLPAPIAAQRPLPTGCLPLVHTLVISTNDPFLSAERSSHLAAEWGSKEIMWIADAGHLASADGYGPWPGIARLLETKIGPLTRKVSAEE